MADYFTKFSVVFNLPDAAAQGYALDLANDASRAQQGDELPGDFPPSLKNAVEVWNFETDPSGTDGKSALWLHSEEGGIDAACAFIQHLLQKFDSSGRVSFEWSNDCSKPRADACGGGAAIITAKKIKSMNTNQWLHKNGGQ